MPRLALIQFIDGGGPVDPGYGMPGYIGGRPDNSLPGGGNINNDLPRPPGSIGTLPVFPFDPTRPDNSLPGPTPTPTPPIQLHPGLKLVVKYMACHGFIAVPDNELPPTGEPK
jgi:hypothetical protein